MLFASLAASLLSAFLAVLGKQWLNRYAITEIRGTAIERSQNRQRKLDGVTTWYFDHVMESLPLMLQAALLLLSCALSRYLWEINTTVASVILGVTSFGIIFYIFVVVAGAASVSCPYQTPGARILRHVFLHTLPHIYHHILLPALHSVPSVIPKLSAFASSLLDFVEDPICFQFIRSMCSEFQQPWYSEENFAIPIVLLILFPISLVADLYFLVDAVIWLLVPSSSTVGEWFMDSFSKTHGLDQQTIALDPQCISWMLQTSLDKAVQLSALKHLATMMALGSFDPTLVSSCFDVFIDCIKVDASNNKVAIIQGLEQLAAMSATCFLRTLHHLSVMDPTSSVLKDIRQRYKRVFPPGTDFGGLPFYYTMTKIRSLANRHWNPRRIQWDECRPPTQEWISFTRNVAEIAQAKYQQKRKVPRWALRFTLHYLSLDPLPPASVVADCLSIIAIGLSCDVSNAGFTTLDERSVHIPQMTTTLTLNQCASGASCEPDSSETPKDGQWWRLQGDHYTSPVRNPAGTRWTI
jgi:hypothetical protein